MSKYYAQNSSGTVRKIEAETDEEAVKKAQELFNSKDVIVGKHLQKTLTTFEMKKLRYNQNRIRKVFES